nr:hypothetical protein [Tanacetum cinerariifolium]
MLFYLTTLNLARFLKETEPQVEPHREFQPSNAHVVQAVEAWNETFQVAIIIEKLPPNWVESKNYLKHKRKEMSVKDLVVRLCIEEDDNKLAQRNTYVPNSAKENTVEHALSSSKSNPKEKAKAKGRMTRRAKEKLIAIIIEKLPPSLVEFKNYLKHKQKEMSVEDLIVRLSIEEEDNKLA